MKEVIKRQFGIVGHVLIWLAFTALYFGVLSQVMDIEAALERSVVNIILLLILFYANVAFVRYCWPAKQYIRYAWGAFVLLFIFTLIRARINILFPGIAAINFTFKSSYSTWAIGAFVSNLSAIVISSLYAIFHISAQQERRNVAHLNAWNEAQLQYLRSQLNPHFLFNTLNNIYSLAVQQSKQTAPMVMQLSRLLRFVLYEAQQDRIPLDQEIQQIHHYIQLFQLRSEEPLEIPFQITGQTADMLIEPMLLIPIVENCFKHSNLERSPTAYIRLQLSLTEKQLCFQAENTYDPTDTQKDGVGGIGMENLRRRVQLSYGDKARVEIQAQETIFNVQLYIDRQAS